MGSRWSLAWRQERCVSRNVLWRVFDVFVCGSYVCSKQQCTTAHRNVHSLQNIRGTHNRTIESRSAIPPTAIYIYICGWSQVRIPRAEYHRKRKGVSALRVMCRFYRFIDYISIIILWHRSMKSRHYRRCASRAQAVYVVSKYQQIAFWFYEINNFAEFITQATGRFK